MSASSKNHSIKKVGSVEVIFHSDPGVINYVDGAEARLLEIYKSANPEKEIQQILADNPSWPMLYHLSKKRGALLDWYQFKKGARVLEVGAGCGAITEALVKNDLEVTALEIDPSRALVNAHRNKHAKNLNIVVDNLETYKPEGKFDYIVCIGVLEYSGKYIKHSDPYGHFLHSMKKHLRDTGTLLLAIENKLGMKYLAGAPEDHTGVIFDSINRYPNNTGFRTFSREELSTLLKDNGFSDTYYYYPHPDYKLPHAIFSDDLFPGHHIESPLSLFPAAVYQGRRYLFSEQAFAMSLESEGLYPAFANSFLVEASPSKLSRQPISASFTQIDRNENFAISTRLIKSPDGDGHFVRKQAYTDKSNKHIESMIINEKIISQNKDLKKCLNTAPISRSGLDETSNTWWLDYAIVPGASLERIFLNSILDEDEETSKKIINRLLKVIDSMPQKDINPCDQKEYVKVFGTTYNHTTACIKPGLIDINLDNIIVNGSGWNLIDYEWLFDFYVPRDYVVGRTLMLFFRNKYAELFRRQYKTTKLVEPVSGMVIPVYIFNESQISHIDFDICYKTECAFQSYVYGRSIKPDESIKKFDKPKTVDSYTSFIDHVDQLEQNDLKLRETLSDQSKLFETQQIEITKLREQNKDLVIKTYRRARSLAGKAKRKLRA